MKPGVQRYVTLFVLAFLSMAVSAIPLAIVCYVLLAALYELAGGAEESCRRGPLGRDFGASSYE